jgi:hypothetical protein
MTTLQAVDEAIRITGVERYRFLCLDHPNEEVRADYRRLVQWIARSGVPVIHAAIRVDYTPASGPCGGCP